MAATSPQARGGQHILVFFVGVLYMGRQGRVGINVYIIYCIKKYIYIYTYRFIFSYTYIYIFMYLFIYIHAFV